MKDLKVVFSGDNSYIDLFSTVEDKNLYEQKALINLVTENGSDKLYDNRGTTLLMDSIRGAVYNKAGTVHVCNFAALDTLFFMKDVEYQDVLGADFTLKDINMDIISYSNTTNTLNVSVQFVFNDDTESNVVADIPTLL